MKLHLILIHSPSLNIAITQKELKPFHEQFNHITKPYFVSAPGKQKKKKKRGKKIDNLIHWFSPRQIDTEYISHF
jgi:hypothetical protein